MTSDLYAFDAAWIIRRGKVMSGADEAGRGAMAGPICAASVVLDGTVVEGIRDSKVISASVRERLFAEILGRSKAVCFVSFPAWWIDRHGVGCANREALERALVASKADVQLADGNLKLEGGITSLPGADASSASVAAASIVAKVLRDHAMQHLAEEFTDYGFEGNKGYGTAAHRDALAEVGPCRVHRFSYAGVGGA